MGGSRMVREDVDHPLPSSIPPPGEKRIPRTVLAPTSCQLLAEDEGGPLAPLAFAADRPTGQHARQLGHVLLRVAAIDTERVELHDSRA